MRDRLPRSWPSFTDPPRKAAEAMRRLEDITRLVSDWVWETDPEFRLAYISQRVMESLQYHPMQLVGKTLAEIGTFTGERPVDWHKPFRDHPFEAKDSEGRMRWMLVSSLPVFEPESGKLTGARGVVRDITEQRRAEIALKRSEENHRNFAADVAHELRTPLAVLRSHLDGNNGGDVGSLRGEVDAMARIVEQLLAASRLEHLTIASSETADLHALAVKVAAYLGPLAIKETRSIEVTGGDAPVTVWGSAAALEQALRNLVENAIRYSARKTTITIEVTPDSTVRVIDRGRGIPESVRQKIFERFARADRRSGGVGLGLAIVRRTVEAHRASIEVCDTPGGGATFTIRFPPYDTPKA